MAIPNLIIVSVHFVIQSQSVVEIPKRKIMTASNENDFNPTLKQLEFGILSGYIKSRERLIEKDLCEL